MSYSATITDPHEADAIARLTHQERNEVTTMSHQTPQADWEMITPSMASAYLDRNERNRRIRRGKELRTLRAFSGGPSGSKIPMALEAVR